ncbi:DUF4974 domain-containing protein [uncultured Gimesia sp.]|uniref:DUF4974 domain-containing protein n=1 Tax=uncultured Gimesia sp. TaxID=1678688 RepID=UPI0030DBC621
MDVTTFQCPQCQALLRMRSRQTAGSTFHCPDCDHPLQLTQTPDGQWTVRQISTPPVRDRSPGFSHKMRAGWNSVRRCGALLLASPVLMSWIVAGTGAVLILLMMLLDRSPSAKVQTEEPVATVSEISSPDATKVEASASTEVDMLQPPAEDVEPTPAPPQPVVEAPPVKAVPLEHVRELIAVKPEHIPPLIAQKPLPPAPLPVPATDVTVALQIPIVEFRQREEVPLKTLITQFEEILDTEFQFAENIENDPQLMETAVAVSRKNTTLEKLLTLILSKGALTYTVKSNKIHIERAVVP